MLGGDNYRIGMAGGSVSSVDTGAYNSQVELSAVQRANPEMQKRVFNFIRALVEAGENPVVMIHDHGAGGHINCFSELLEELGGRIDLAALPVGDPTLSARELVCNESQERMGLVVPRSALPLLEKLSERERCPMYVVGEITGEEKVVFQAADGSKPVDLALDVLFGASPKTVLVDETREAAESPTPRPVAGYEEFKSKLDKMLALEAVGSKDWLTNKVDRSVTGRVLMQQCAGQYQLPVNDAGVVALDFTAKTAIANALGHAPVPGLADPEAGSVLSIAEAITNLAFVPLEKGLGSVVLSANWMWPAKQNGENARLYRAVRAASDFAQALRIAIPTGKDSMSMTMRYSDGADVKAPGTVVITAAGHCDAPQHMATVDFKPIDDSEVVYVDLSSDNSFPLGGSAWATVNGVVGSDVPSVKNPAIFAAGFNIVQELLRAGKILAGHDISAGGLITALLEMAISSDVGAEVFADTLEGASSEVDFFSLLLCEKPGLLLQVRGTDMSSVLAAFADRGVLAQRLARLTPGVPEIMLCTDRCRRFLALDEYRRKWMKTSFRLDRLQVAKGKAEERFSTFDQHPLHFVYPTGFTGQAGDYGVDLHRTTATGLQAAIVREKGTNGDREMAFAMHAAGFDVRDVAMSDLVAGREDLSDVRFLVFPGGFSNSDVLGAARGWAGVFRYNPNAMDALQNFYQREDTMSLGVCNGCQLVTLLNVIAPNAKRSPQMLHNDSGKFESTFLAVEIPENRSIMLRGLAGTRLGIWVAHGEGKFSLPEDAAGHHDIVMQYVSSDYPANPNGSDFNTAGITSLDGRHLAMMPHLERAVFPWQWAYLPELLREEKAAISPWMLAFVAARDWLKENRQ
ncbi:MAG: phosphoribosylformylglycinamidine synthase, partial [bacterium]|nr:phosphoribosylformylglycinamidine synthase [bacterium]